MAVLRLTLLALAACAPAAADAPPAPDAERTPSPGTPSAPSAGTPSAPSAIGHAQVVPPRWEPLAPMVAAMRAVAPGAAVDAWGDPAQGCYAIWLTLPGTTGDAPALADQLLGSLTGITVSEVVRPSGPDGDLTFELAKPPYRGRMRAHLVRGQILATACFGNLREPAACRAACARVLEDVP